MPRPIVHPDSLFSHLQRTVFKNHEDLIIVPCAWWTRFTTAYRYRTVYLRMRGGKTMSRVRLYFSEAVQETIAPEDGEPVRHAALKWRERHLLTLAAGHLYLPESAAYIPYTSASLSEVMGGIYSRDRQLTLGYRHPSGTERALTFQFAGPTEGSVDSGAGASDLLRQLGDKTRQAVFRGTV